MPDVKDVIKGLEESIAFFRDRVTGDMYDKWLHASVDALALLKAQEPVLAVKLQSKNYIGRTEIAYDGSCGNCNTYLFRTWRACPLCGKVVKWE